MTRGTEKTQRSLAAIRLWLYSEEPISLETASRRVGLKYRPRIVSPRRTHTRIRRAAAMVVNRAHPCSVEEACRRVGLRQSSHVYALLRKQGTPITRPPRKIDRAVNLYLTSEPPLTLSQVARYVGVSSIALSLQVTSRGGRPPHSED